MFPVQRCSLYVKERENPPLGVKVFICWSKAKRTLPFFSSMAEQEVSSLLPHIMQTQLENPRDIHLSPPTHIQPAPVGPLSVSGRAGSFFWNSNSLRGVVSKWLERETFKRIWFSTRKDLADRVIPDRQSPSDIHKSDQCWSSIAGGWHRCSTHSLARM